ncbi:MAG: cation:proton antiporter [Aquabacterium sp.]
MDHTAPLPFLRETLVFLALAGILIPLLQRLRINQVIGFLIMGVVVGPYGAGSLADTWPWLASVTIPRREGVQALAELGVIFLMFLIGLELSLPRVWAMRRWVFGAGTAQVLGSALVIGVTAYGFGNTTTVSLVLGLVLSLSSTAVVMQLLTHSRRLATPLGQAAFAILMLQDMAVVPLLIVVDLLARNTTDGVVTEILSKSLLSVGVVAAILIGGRKLVPFLFRTFAQQRQSEVFTALTLLVALSIAGATALAGLSMALGALLAGLLLAETEYRHEVEVTIEPFKGLLMGLFFMSVGMGIDVQEVVREPVRIVMSVIGLLMIKAVVVTLLLRRGGLSWGQSVEGGALLGQGGEFAFIVIGSALSTGLVTGEIGQFMLMVVSLSLLVTPLVARLGQKAGRRLDARGKTGAPPQPGPEELPEVEGHAVVIGYGRVGQLLGEVLAQQDMPFVAVEHNVERVGRMRDEGKPVYFGNASRPELLRKLKLARAACLLVTMDEPLAARRVVHSARIEFPELPIFARAHDEPHAQELYDAGATMVVPETLEAGLLLTSFALNAAGLPEHQVNDILSDEREKRFGFVQR